MKCQPRGDSHTILRPGFLFCWNCGRGGKQPPENWHAPWMIQIAHIASGQGRALRVDDARAVVSLCPLCHSVHISDAQRLKTMTVAGLTLPTIDETHTLYIQREMVPELYSPDFLAMIWHGKVPEPVRPPVFWCREFTSRTGILR